MRRNPTYPIVALLAAGIAITTPSLTSADYVGPVAVTAAKDGSTLFVAASDAQQVLTVDAAAGRVVRRSDVPGAPTAMALGPRGNVLYVACAAPRSAVCAIDTVSGEVAASIPAGHTATGLAISPDGERLWVCNRFDNDVAVIDIASKSTTARIPTAREPVGAAITPDGKSVFVINHLPNDPADTFDVAARVTVIDAATNSTTTIRLPNGSSSLRGVCASSDGRFVLVTHILGRYHHPTTQLTRGWMNTNAVSVLDAVEKKLVNTVLLDDVELGAANPWGVATTADGKSICVTHSGTHELSVIATPALLAGLRARPRQYDSDVTNVSEDLAFLVPMRQRIRLGGSKVDAKINGPRGVAVVSNRAYVASYFTDRLAVVDLDARPGAPISTIALGPDPKLTLVRRGEMLFHDAEICFQEWQSCASCHPDGRVDALNWDLMNDGLGNPKSVRSMVLAHRTPPSMASAVRATTEQGVRAGIRFILFSVRPEEDAVAIDEYCKSLAPVPSPYLVDGELSPAARRGKELFSDEEVNCARCHPAPLFTDRRLHDVGSRAAHDARDAFDTPTLIECWRTAPYMHDGRYVTVKELLTTGEHGHKGTGVAELTEQQLSDLIEFVLSL